MAKPKEGKQEEFYKGEIRKLKKEVKQLRQQLRLENNIDELRQELTEMEQETEFHREPPKIHCTDCGKGFFAEFELLGKVYGTCDICGHRKRLK